MLDRKLVFLDIGSRGKVPSEWKSIGKFCEKGIEVHTFDLDPKSKMMMYLKIHKMNIK